MMTKLSYAKLDRRTLLCSKDGCSMEYVVLGDVELSPASRERYSGRSQTNTFG
jgi:hypothetical protein